MTNRICSIDDCESVHLARGYCSKHYGSEYLLPNLPPCSVDECTNRAKARGLCPKHDWRVRHYGTTDAPPQPTPKERLMARIKKVTTDGCWLIQNDPNTYAVAKNPSTGRLTTAHRLSLSLERGRDIDDEMVVDHLCSTPACINPDHLEVTTQRENTMRSKVSRAGKNARKLYCKRGHPLFGDNLYLHSGRRHCRTCRAKADRDKYLTKGKK